MKPNNMVKFSPLNNSGITRREKARRTNNKSSRYSYKRLARMGKISADIIDELYSPIDSVNRFINLTLQTIEENSQGREFLLESKEGIRKASHLLKKLNNYAKRIEREAREISATDE